MSVSVLLLWMVAKSMQRTTVQKPWNDSMLQIRTNVVVSTMVSFRGAIGFRNHAQ